MKIQFYLAEKCRFCQSSDMELVLPLTPSPLCDQYLTERKFQEVFPLDLYLCRECGLSQIKCVVDPEYIYRDYIYVTTSSSGLVKHFEKYAEDVVARLCNNKISAVLDIGSNDGSLLKCFKSKGLSILGVEPAREIAAIANRSGVNTIADYFNEEVASQIKGKYGLSDVVTINNLFANIDDVDEFVESIKYVLSENGFIVIESAYLGNMIENTMFDFIYHEHLSCISIIPLEKFFQKHDMKLIDLQPVSTKGGSMRYYFTRNASNIKKTESVDSYRNIEIKSELNSMETFDGLNKRIVERRNELLSYLLKNSSKNIVGYGASATSTTFIYHFGIGAYLKALVDNNPGKIGTYSPGLQLEVFDSDYIYDNNIDIVLLVAWRYSDLIMRKHKKFNGEFVVPLPEFKVYRNN